MPKHTDAGAEQTNRRRKKDICLMLCPPHHGMDADVSPVQRLNLRFSSTSLHVLAPPSTAARSF